MLTITLLTLAAAQPIAAPIPFDAITLERAAELDGRPVTVTFTSARPAYTWGEGKGVRTWCGPAEGDDVERTVSLRGNRLAQADEGAKLRVSGRLRVIRHPTAVVGGLEVPAWTEIRVEE